MYIRGNHPKSKIHIVINDTIPCGAKFYGANPKTADTSTKLVHKEDRNGGSLLKMCRICFNK